MIMDITLRKTWVYQWSSVMIGSTVILNKDFPLWSWIFLFKGIHEDDYIAQMNHKVRQRQRTQ